MKDVRIAALVIGTIVLGAAAGMYLYLSSEFTECYGVFESRRDAERAATSARDADLGTDVDHRAGESAVTFDSGETGADALGAKRSFREILRANGGELGHPGDGCIERSRFE